MQGLEAQRLDLLFVLAHFSILRAAPILFGLRLSFTFTTFFYFHIFDTLGFCLKLV